MNVIVFLSCAALFVGYVLPNHYVPWVSFYQESAAFVAGLLMFFSLLLARLPKRLNFPIAYLLLPLLACIPVLQYLIGPIHFFGDALNSVVYILFFAGALFVGFNLIQCQQLHPSILHYLAGTLIAASLASVFLALYQWFLQPSILWVADLRPGGRPFANLAQPNHLATLMAMGLAAVLFFYEKRLLHRISSSLLVVIFLFVIALTQSRTPWLMAVFFVIIWLWKSAEGKRRLSSYWALAWVAIYVCFVLFLPYLSELLQLSSLSSVAQRAQAYSRWPLYKQFVQAIFDGPLWGYGWQQAGTAQLSVAPFYDQLEYSEYTHNILLDLLVWNGPVIGLVIIAVVAAYLLRLAFLVHSTDHIFAVVAVGFFLLHSFLEYPHAYAYFLLPVGVLIGCVQAGISCKTWHVPRYLVAVLLLVAGGVYVATWHEYRIIEEDFRLLRFEKGRIGTLKADKPAPDIYLLTQLQALTRHARLPATTGLTDSELEQFAVVARRFSQGPSIYKYIQVLALNNQLEKADEQLILLKNLHGEEFYKQVLHELKQQRKVHAQTDKLLDQLRKTD